MPAAPQQLAQNAPDVSLIPLASTPGIRRDGTQLDGDQYSDGVWTRFYRGRPKKIGGYRRVTNQMGGPSRALGVYKRQDLFDVYNFHVAGIEALAIDKNGSGSGPIDRTPALGFVEHPDYLWQHDFLFDSTGGGATKIIAHAGRTALNIDDRTEFPVWFGDVNSSAQFITTGTSVSGGCVVLQPFLFVYGNDGLIKNSDRNDPTNFVAGGGSLANEANVAGTKIVKGLPIRGGGNAPSGLFWALDALIRVAFTNDDRIFSYDTVSKASILAQNSVVEHDGLYYWIGADRFLVYGGSIREVKNQMNLDWFFNHLNWEHRNKIFVHREPHFGEIWWVFPKDTSTEPNHAIIYNVREETWYDTPLARASAIHNPVLRYPMMVGLSPLTAGDSHSYPIYLHEFGVDAIEGDHVLAIESRFETSNFGPAGSGDQLMNRWLRIERIEPDFVQTGEMAVTVLGQRYAKSLTIERGPFYFDPTTERVDIREQFRHVRLRFSSNTENGDFFMGKTLVSVNLGEQRE